MRHGAPARPPHFQQTRQGRLLLWIVGVALGAFLIGYIATALLVFPGRDRDVVTMPDVRGGTEAEARRALERVGLEVERANSLVHPQVPAGVVLAQGPLPGREVARGSPVRVTLSAGRERRRVPEIGALTSEQARQFLARAGFEVEVEEVENPRRTGTVLETDPTIGTMVEMPGRVRLVVSSGPPPVVVPDLADLPESAARDALAAVGLRLGEVEYDPFAPGTLGGVVSQRPAAGATIPVGSQVHVTIAGFSRPPDLPPQIL
ncbi:MAG: PASTA domain-containing protein [Longimicrobiaceae bacterium]